MNSKTDDLITRFLLGELPEDERRMVEERFLTDNAFFEEILAAEDSLVDQYLLETLDDEQRARAKTLLECTREQKLNVEFTRELIGLVRASSATEVEAPDSINEKIGKSQTDLTKHGPIYAGLMKQVPTANWIRFSVVLLLLISTAWIVYLYSRERALEATRRAAERSNYEISAKLGEQLEKSQTLSKELESEREQRRNAEVALAQSQPERPASISSVLLTPASFIRDGNSKVVNLNLKSGRVRLQLALNDKPLHDEYSVLITTFEGRKIWSSDSVNANQIRQDTLSLILPGSLFEYDDYKIELKGRQDNGDFVHVADYAFRVRN